MRSSLDVVMFLSRNLSPLSCIKTSVGVGFSAAAAAWTSLPNTLPDIDARMPSRHEKGKKQGYSK